MFQMFLDRPGIFPNPFDLLCDALCPVSEFRSYVPNWCRPRGGEHEDDWRLVAGYSHPIFSICAK